MPQRNILHYTHCTTSVIITLYGFINWYDDFITQQHFELKLTMPPTGRDGRGYSDEHVTKATNELLTL